jgi:polyketide cyclase/dehydrase/lipid transport protein
MARVVVKGEIEVPADRLWKLVADFGNVGWIPGGESARTEGNGPGMVRIIDMGAGEIRERLESRDEAAQTIVYTIPQGLPMPITDYRATMIVRALGDRRSELEWSCTFQPDGVPEAEPRAQLENLYTIMIGWIRDRLTR